jgi:hypothetical protein
MSSSHELIAKERDEMLTYDDLSRHLGDVDETKDHDSTPKGLPDNWRFTPSLMDPNSFAFSSFANLPPGYYTPTPGGVNTLYHSQAGDLHTPGMGMHIGTPLSLPQTAHGLSTANVNAPLHHFQPPLLQAHHFESVSDYAPQQVFAPSSFLQHKDSGYEAMSQSPHQTPHSKVDMIGMLPPGANLPVGQSAEGGMPASSGVAGEK